MKTTINFPDDLLHRAKIVAAQRKTTLKDIVLQGVDYVITHPATLTGTLSQGGNSEPVDRLNRDDLHDHHEEVQRKVNLRRLLAAMKATNTEPMAPLTREEIHAGR